MGSDKWGDKLTANIEDVGISKLKSLSEITGELKYRIELKSFGHAVNHS